MIIYEWLDRRGDPLLGGWRLEARQRRQLKTLVLSLEAVDYEMANGTLIFKKGGAPDVYYCKLNGDVALRPRCCLGPELSAEEFQHLREVRKLSPPETARFPAGKAELLTFLERVSKKDQVEDPPMNRSSAPNRLQEIKDNRQARQPVTFHETGGRA